MLIHFRGHVTSDTRSKRIIGCDIIYSGSPEGQAPIAEYVSFLPIYHHTLSLIIIRSVVFVHGLTGNALDTWTFQQRDKKEDKKICWPRDVLPQVRNDIRVIVFGYDADVAHWFTRAASDTLEDHCNNLLLDLKNHRTDSESVRSGIHRTRLTIIAITTPHLCRPQSWWIGY